MGAPTAALKRTKEAENFSERKCQLVSKEERGDECNTREDDEETVWCPVASCDKADAREREKTCLLVSML